MACSCPECMMKMHSGIFGGGGMGEGMIPTMVQIPGMGGSMGCGNPNCVDCGGGGMSEMGGAQCSCADPTCPIGCQSFIAGCPCGDCQRQLSDREGSGREEMIPLIMDQTFCRNPNCSGCGGGGIGVSGRGMPPPLTWTDIEGSRAGMQGGQTPPPSDPDVGMIPAFRCLGMTGQEIDCAIDAGMQSHGQLTPSAYRKHFAGTPIDTSVRYSSQGVGAQVSKMLGRFPMVLRLEFGDERVEVSGNIWIYPNENVACELMIGMNFLKDNKMNIRPEDGGETIEIQGKKFPLKIIPNQFYRQLPLGQPAYEGSGGKMFKLGGSDITTRNGYIVGKTLTGVHAYNARQHNIAAGYCMRGHDVRHKHMDHVSAIEDGNEEPEEALNLSREAKPNKRKTLAGTNSEEGLWAALALSPYKLKLNNSKELQRQLLLAPSSSLADLQKLHNLSVEDMARIISRRATERSKVQAISRKGKAPPQVHCYDDDADEDMKKAIALSLQDMK